MEGAVETTSWELLLIVFTFKYLGGATQMKYTLVVTVPRRKEGPGTSHSLLSLLRDLFFFLTVSFRGLYTASRLPFLASL